MKQGERGEYGDGGVDGGEGIVLYQRSWKSRRWCFGLSGREEQRGIVISGGMVSSATSSPARAISVAVPPQALRPLASWKQAVQTPPSGHLDFTVL